jgi:hypothetical protein
MTALTTTLEQAVTELRAFNMEHPLDLMRQVEEMKPPGDEYVRLVLMPNGQVYKVCLTRMFMAKSWLWMLSIMKPYGESNQEGARLPTAAEAAEIAESFFPKGFTALNDGMQIVTKTCLKFIATDLEVANE